MSASKQVCIRKQTTCRAYSAAHSLIQAINEHSIEETKERFLDAGAVPAPMTPEAFGDYIRPEIARWSDVVKTSGAKAE
jgi:tripartite-type tricarboxylate transporter receptor subunit TctC